MSTWSLPDQFEENFPMALDAPEHRLLVVTPTPPRLLVLDTVSGETVAALPCVADADDLYYDSNYRRV